VLLAILDDMTKESTLDQRLDRIDDQLERIAKVVATGFETARQDQESVRAEVRQAIDIYAWGR
jgi:hypothetical protein